MTTHHLLNKEPKICRAFVLMTQLSDEGIKLYIKTRFFYPTSKVNTQYTSVHEGGEIGGETTRRENDRDKSSS